jgi:hypothetical protein
MADNVHLNVVELPMPSDPSYKSSSIVTQKIYPVSSVIDAANYIQGNLQFEWTVPSGYRQLCDRTSIVFDCGVSLANGNVSTTAGPAPNFCSTFFQTARFEINDYLVAQSNNVPQDDTMIKRMINSQIKNITSNSCSKLYGTDAARFAEWGTIRRQGVAWFPDCVISRDAVIPQNVKCRITLSINPNMALASVANNPSVVDIDGNANTTVTRFYDMYMLNTYVKVDVPTPKTVYLPAYAINSSYQILPAATSFNGQWSVPKDTYKLVVGLQANGVAVATGATCTKFTSGTAGATQSVESLKLSSLQLRYGNQTYPATAYQITETATRTNSIQPYLDYLAATDALLDPSGSYDYETWSDPKTTADASLGRLFAFNLVKPANSNDTQAELMMNFAAAITAGSTRVIVFSITKVAIAINYNDQNNVSEIKAVSYA